MDKRKCKQCGEEFTLTDSEIKFYNDKGLNLPKRCSECRKKNNNINNDVVVALQVLGYSKKEAETVLEKIDTNGLSIEETIKQALKYLGR